MVETQKKQDGVTLMEEMVSSKGPAEKFGLRSPSSSNFDSVSCNEFMLFDENAGGSFTDDVRKLYLSKKKTDVPEQREIEVR